jgi:transglutaminase-like putative cysteine protease
LKQIFEAEEIQAPVKLPPLSVPAEGRLHLLPFLIPTTICDAQHKAVVDTARSLVPAGISIREKAMLIRNWIRENIKYTLDDRKAKASDTLAKREGMCTNKANLQIAMMRAVGVPSGYRLVHITKECFRTPQMLPELFEKIHEPTVHCFAAVYIPDVGMDGKSLVTGQWYNFDATERLRGPGESCAFLHEEEGTGETRYQDRWIRGPLGPVQANLDHLLLMKPSQRWKLAKDLFDRQNEILRKHGDV